MTLRARGRGANNRTSQEEESKASAPTELQQPPQSCQQQDDDELPLARVRDDALARKACLSFAYCFLIKDLMHVGHLLYRIPCVTIVGKIKTLISRGLAQRSCHS